MSIRRPVRSFCPTCRRGWGPDRAYHPAPRCGTACTAERKSSCQPRQTSWQGSITISETQRSDGEVSALEKNYLSKKYFN